MTFVVAGGGPTGCEFCGELSDFVKNDLRRFYPKLAPLAPRSHTCGAGFCPIRSR